MKEHTERFKLHPISVTRRWSFTEENACGENACGGTLSSDARTDLMSTGRVVNSQTLEVTEKQTEYSAPLFKII